MKNKGKSKEGVDKDGVVGHTDDFVFEETEEGRTEAHPEDKIKKLQKKLKECLSEKQEYLNGWQRAKADIVNLRKDEEKRRADLSIFVQEGLFFELLPALDSFDMAFENKETWEKVDENWRIGVEHIHTQLLTIFQQYNFVPFDPIGEKFDPAKHNSVESVTTEKKNEDNKVIKVLQKGYTFNGKVVRPANVKVAQYKK